MSTPRGDVTGRLDAAPNAQRAVLTVGGVGGGRDTSADDLYPRLGEVLPEARIACPRVRYRHPTRLNEAVSDVLTGIAYLQGEGITRIGLVGHSLGGAVVIRAAAESPSVRTVVTLATQSYGADPAADLASDCSLLLIHGQADDILSSHSSEAVYREAGEPKRLILIPNADHVMNGAAAQVQREVISWLLESLA